MTRKELSFKTHRRSEPVEITEFVREAVRESGVAEGFVHVFVPHTTAGVTLNEHIDPRVMTDLLAHLDRAVPWGGAWTHPVNAAAHIKASLIGHTLTLAVAGGAPRLGSWQGIYFCEFNGPRARTVWLTVQPSE